MKKIRAFYFRYRYGIGIVVALFLFVAFFICSRLVRNGQFSQHNFDFTVKLQDSIPQKYTEFFEDVSFFVSPVVSTVICVLLTLVHFFVRRGKRFSIKAFSIIIVFVLLILAESYGKTVVRSPAPPFFMIKNATTIFPKYYVFESYSYPSGHAGRAVFLGSVFMLLIIQKWRANRILFLGSLALVSLYIFVISIGKIYLGHHWASDVAGGWIIALGCSSVVYTLLLDEG